MRSLPGQQSLGPREQVNQNTAFLDASQVHFVEVYTFQSFHAEIL